jgi:excisionase family DNA binding protein
MARSTSPTRTPTFLAPAYYSINDVAGLLNVTPRLVRKLIAAGDLEAVRFSPRIVRIPAAALAAALRPYTSPASERGRVA